jgi:hypothetical protein
MSLQIPAANATRPARRPARSHETAATRRTSSSSALDLIRYGLERLLDDTGTTARTIRSHAPLFVSKTDNMSRVRDGYTSESTAGHARALATHGQPRTCRTNVAATDRACKQLPPPNLHGKEGVNGSSPSEGFEKIPANEALT